MVSSPKGDGGSRRMWAARWRRCSAAIFLAPPERWFTSTVGCRCHDSNPKVHAMRIQHGVTMRHVVIAFIALTCVTAAAGTSARQARAPYRTLDDRFEGPRLSTMEAWKPRAAYVREHVLASAGLLPMPEKGSLRPSIFGQVTHPDYTVSK